jgi:hypothetical protein
MADSSGSIFLLDVLTSLLADHVPKEVAFFKALREYTNVSQSLSGDTEDDEPDWELTPWEVAVRFLAARSAFFGTLSEEHCFDETPIETYERLLREFVASVKHGGPSSSNGASVELVELDRRGVAEQLCREVKSKFPQLDVPRTSDDAANQSRVDEISDSFLTHTDLAKRFGRDAEPTRKRLDRWRAKNSDGWHEVQDRPVNQPKYLYRLSAVRALFETA